jgi:hypothetical protein
MSTSAEAETPAPPKVFISYSWTSDEHADWVLDLATRLRRSSSVDVVLDRWDLKPGQDKFKFMEQMSTDPTVQRVLVICDKRYAERADARLGGVGTESTIISQEVYNQVAQEKFIPIVAERDLNDEPFLPVFLKSRLYIDLSDPRRYEAGYEELVLAIGGQRPHVKPPLGKAPSFVAGSRPAPPTTHARRAFEDALLKDKPHATGLAEDYLDALVEALRSLRLDDKEQLKSEELPKLMVEQLEAWTPLRDEFVEFLRFISRYNKDARLFDLLPRFFEKWLGVMTGDRGSQQNQHINYIAQETFLYAVAVLLQQERFEAVSALLDEQYRDVQDQGRLQRYGIFSQAPTQYLESVLRSTWDQQYRYDNPLWELTRRRATNNTVPLEALREADLLLFVRVRLDEEAKGIMHLSWHAMTLTFDPRWDSGLKCPTFERAASRRYFSRFKTVLGVDSKEMLLQRWNAEFPPVPETAGLVRSSSAMLIQKLISLDRMDTI